ncbi:MAG TPA: cob(I)yrinic acid a,c-diamide adenosyltransferase [Acidobacteriaceae bacterium]|jgi:cob(I)alamin adenosyltransferase
MSIATKLGDTGQTGLVGGARVSKADLRVESYGTVDELNAALGLARSLCPDESIRTATERIQRTLFRVGGSLATPAESRKGEAVLSQSDVDELTEQVHRIEAVEGILADWSLPGAQVPSAAFEVARTVCRRAERCVVRLAESGEEVQPEVLAYLNRLSDLIWLFGRLLERNAGDDARLREDGSGGRWTRAW